MNNSKTLIALLAGIAAGAALGLLFAPEKGSDTRDKLAESLKNLGDSIKEKAANEIDNLNDYKERVVTNVKSRVQQAEDDFAQSSGNV